jgi:hypothetical protein
VEPEVPASAPRVPAPARPVPQQPNREEGYDYPVPQNPLEPTRKPVTTTTRAPVQTTTTTRAPTTTTTAFVEAPLPIYGAPRVGRLGFGLPEGIDAVPLREPLSIRDDGDNVEDEVFQNFQVVQGRQGLKGLAGPVSTRNGRQAIKIKRKRKEGKRVEGVFLHTKEEVVASPAEEVVEEVKA